MKKISPFLLAVMLVVCMAVPTFANTESLPYITLVNQHDYLLVCRNPSNNVITAQAFTEWEYDEKNGITMENVDMYLWEDGKWRLYGTFEGTAANNDLFILYSNIPHEYLIVDEPITFIELKHNLPPLPNGNYDYWVITYYYSDDIYRAWNFNTTHGYSSFFLLLDDNDSYLLSDGQWIDGGEADVEKDHIIYDSSDNTEVGTGGITFLSSPKSLIEEIQSVLERMKGQFSLAIAVQLLAVVVVSVIGIVFLWWGVRKLTRVVFSAFRKGKISV